VDDSIARNRAQWDADAPQWAEGGRRGWQEQPRWGIWHVPESDLHLLHGVEGKDAVELGCGTAYISAWLARRGARPVGVDPSREQLRTARRLQQDFGLTFPLVQAAGEHVPLRTASFDFVISEYGAAIWADPYLWIPEAARLLRTGGELAFLGTSTLNMLCIPDEDDVPPGPVLLRPLFGMHRLEWPDFDGVEFHLSPGDMIRLLRVSGFEVTDLVELRPAPDAESSFPYASLEWARKWPTEEVWRARRR
jgi:SAM-dependent methyltransferase